QANVIKLEKYGIADQMEQINKAAVKIARAAAADKAYVVGTIGSVRDGKRGNVRTVALTEALYSQIRALLSENVDGLLFETFYEYDEMELALKIAREETNIPIICQFAVDEIGRTLDGVKIKDAFQRLVELG